ncbi:MAG TPA: ATP-binding protein, partial [Rectinemataceae bacterium]|nr:ATP-binding protein [Rectinemataceae bacterium]
VRLELSRAEGRGEGAQTLPLLISVSDTGIGMPPEKVESAFERFTQLDGSSTRRAGGAGLGLDIVRKSLESIGGRVEVDSAPGRGTRVTAHLSLGLPEGDAESAREEALRARRLVITGFGEEEGGDLEELASSMGAECLFADRLEEAAAMRGLPLVICDERILHRGGGGSLALPEKSLAALSRRLIVAVRFGSPCRAWTGFPEGVAFATMPLRAGRLSDAVAALGRPAEERTAGPEGTAAAGAQDAEQRGLLLDFAEALEEASRSGIAGEAERIAKEMSKDCARLGFREGERLAFSALLATRKGEAAGLARFALRARSLAGLCQGSAGKTDYAEG